MVEDEIETTSEELPPHLREEPPEGTILEVIINSFHEVGESVLPKEDLFVYPSDLRAYVCLFSEKDKALSVLTAEPASQPEV